ncbi:Uncharacterized protein TCM_001563 [Theobroma cacao]|uniref:Uncharacterized protein n=1 Tax=Theobroma cacao TaxID=3641 RepID=A0A061DJ61_THECC|nr:Uncharacterized protein TCM_001563 [Theobroma cacao]
MFMIRLTDSAEPGSAQKLIESFDYLGKPIFHFINPITSHCLWDINCTCEGGQEDSLATDCHRYLKSPRIPLPSLASPPLLWYLRATQSPTGPQY